MKYLITALIFYLLSSQANAQTYKCDVLKKLDRDRQYSLDDIQKYQFSNILETKNDEAFISRCSFQTSKNKITCDRYKIDKTILDNFVSIKKYYIFKSQYDFQLYDDLSFVENNGRGGISYGVCKI
jgi:hypothetical protein